MWKFTVPTAICIVLHCIFSADATQHVSSSISSSSSCQCTGPNLCPSRAEFDRFRASRPSACKACFMRSCSFVDRRDLLAFGSCVLDAHFGCSSCPRFDRDGIRRIKMCRSCNRRCGRFPVQRHNTCQARCTYYRLCPSPGEIIQVVTGTTQRCRDCVRNTCGVYGSSNRYDVAYCMYSARMSCSACTLSDADHHYRRRCMSCVRRCEDVRGTARPPRPSPTRTVKPPTPTSTRTVRPPTPTPTRTRPPTPTPTRTVRPPTPTPTRTRPPTPTPTRTRPPSPTPPESREQACRRFCSERGRGCPTTLQIMATFQRFTPSCRGCVREICGEAGSDNQATVADCTFQARASCAECELTAAAERQRANCRRCIIDCASRQGGNGRSSTQPPMTSSTGVVVVIVG